MRFVIPSVSLCTSFLHLSRRRTATLRHELSAYSSSSSLSTAATNQTQVHNNDDEPCSFASTYHTPVMWKECIDALITSSSSKTEPRIFVDGTLGGGGHAEALLQQLKPGDLLIGCDVDSQALATASERLQKYMTTTDNDAADSSDLPTFQTIQSNFANLHQALPAEYMGRIDGLLLDLGVSSHQIDSADRGFSFQQDGPLDMRMNAKTPISSSIFAPSSSLTAAHICNEFDQVEIQRLLTRYADEPRAKAIAQAIVEHRPLVQTSDLVQAVSSVVPVFHAASRRKGRQATLARVFSALRISVNQELSMLEQAMLTMAPAILKPGSGVVAVLSYHSLEDRIVKRVMRDGCIGKVVHVPKDMYGNYNGPAKPFRPVGKKRKATKEEVEINSRARSATLRVAERLSDGE
ncbi:hypothetical protein MPSEU_000919200 [Mayamaea pseudoterrestris]|nr:hypothetical protein MPSEU_000919200 [Mayamaea pseudoterrestris]